MDSKKAEALLRKYWDGKTDLSEEKELKKHFSTSLNSGALSADYFNNLRNKSYQNPLGDDFDEELLRLIDQDNNVSKQKNIAIKYWYVAASLALIFSVSIIFKNEIFKAESPAKVVQADTFEDPEKAFEETKKALMFISSKLNQSSDYAIQFSKFEQSQNHLKQN